MKKFTILLFVLAISSGLTVFAQGIPNGDFEEWEQGLYGFETPVAWESIGSLAGMQDVFKVSPGQSGDFALELKPFIMTGFPDYFATFIMTAFPYNQRSANLSGYLKGAAEGDDTLSILITMTKDGEPIGFGYKELSQSFGDFTSFSLPILYSGLAVPDSVIILFTLGDFEGSGNENTAYTFDNLSLSGVAGINDHSIVFGEVKDAYPNPATTTLTIPFVLNQADLLKVKVFDAQGRLVLSENSRAFNVGTNEIVLSTSSLKQGFYFYTIIPSDGKGVSKSFVVK